jgi:hypothetical protein
MLGILMERTGLHYGEGLTNLLKCHILMLSVSKKSVYIYIYMCMFLCNHCKKHIAKNQIEEI